MLELDSVNLEESIAMFMRSYTIIDLLNHRLENQSVMEELLSKNQISYISSKLPGIIIQVYLLLVRKFGLNVYGPITGEVRETRVDNVHSSEDQKVVIEEVKEKILPSLVPLNAERDQNEVTLVLEEVKTEHDDTGTV